MTNDDKVIACLSQFDYSARMKNIIEAAAHVGISKRSLQRYKDAGRIPVHFTRGKTRDVMMFEESDLDALKHDLENPKHPAPSQIVTAPGTDTSADESQALALTNTSGRLTEFAGLITKTIEATLTTRRASPAELAPKLMLSIPEAAALSGVAVATLRRAVQDKKLKTVAGIGGGYGKIKRADLDAYIKKL